MESDGRLCPAVNNLLSQPVRSRFQPIPAIKLAHRIIPRFGRSDDIADAIFLGSSADVGDYLRGVLTGTLCIFVVFVIWMIVLFIFKMQGPNVYGWLSGSRRPMPPCPILEEGNNDLQLKEESSPDRKSVSEEEAAIFEGQEDAPTLSSPTQGSVERNADDIASISDEKDEIPSESAISLEACDTPDLDVTDEAAEIAEETSGEDFHPVDKNVSDNAPGTVSKLEWFNMYERRLIQNRRMRRAVIVSLFAIIFCSIVTIIKGVPGLKNTTDVFREALDEGYSLADRGLDTANLLVEDLTIAYDTLADFSIGFNSICPEVTESICEDLNMDNCVLIDEQSEIRIFKVIVEYLSSRVGAIDEAVSIGELLEGIKDEINGVEGKVAGVSSLFYISTIFEVFLICICLVVLFKLYRNESHRIRKAFQNITMGIFLTFVLISFIFAFAFVIASTVFADVCVDSPDDTFLYILQKKSETSNELKRQVFLYFHSKCTTVPLAPLQSLMVNVSNSLRELSSSLQSLNVTEFEEVCGPIDTSVWTELARNLAKSTCGITERVIETRDLLSCNSWYPLYETAIHKGVCYSVDDLAWIAWVQFFVVIFAFVVMTCRVVLFEEVELEDKGLKEDPVDQQ